jgi:hypothetical protein
MYVDKMREQFLNRLEHGVAVAFVNADFDGGGGWSPLTGIG